MIDQRRSVLSAIAWMMFFSCGPAIGQTIYWVDRGSDRIRQGDLDDGEIRDVYANSFDSPFGIAIDGAGQKMYWTDPGVDAIFRANLDGTDVEELYTSDDGLRGARAVALDLNAAKLYWAAYTSADDAEAFQRANLDGSSRETLFTFPHRGVQGIALDTVEGKVYWTETDVFAVHRANVDGSEQETVASGQIGVPHGVAIDPVERKVYWANASSMHRIERANLDGSQRETFCDGLEQPTGITLDSSARKLYWADRWASKIQRANLDGSNVETLWDSPEARYPWSLSLDLSTGYVYWTEEARKIKRAHIDGGDVEDLVTGQGMRVEAFAVDVVGSRMYWPEYDGIRSADFYAAAATTLISVYQSNRIALDPADGKIYWTEGSNHNLVRRANTDGTHIEDLLRAYDPIGLTLDLAVKEILFASGGAYGPYGIRRAELDGSGVELVLQFESGYSSVDRVGIAVDIIAGKVYWTAMPMGVIRRADLTGSSVEDLVSGLMEPNSIALDLNAGLMYWTDLGTESIQRASLDGSNVETLFTGLNEPLGVQVDPCRRANLPWLEQHQVYLNCMTGPGAFVSPGCHCGDLSGDARSDLVDFALLQQAFVSSN